MGEVLSFSALEIAVWIGSGSPKRWAIRAQSILSKRVKRLIWKKSFDGIFFDGSYVAQGMRGNKPIKKVHKRKAAF
ncbi:hypothetical protein VYA_30800 [Vibrio alfacsensis]|nr:hypothetical protein VYA_30800 [Vibrio alfacsensis]